MLPESWGQIHRRVYYLTTDVVTLKSSVYTVAGAGELLPPPVHRQPTG